MSIKLFVSDVDGTILPKGGRISERTRAAVHAAEDRGIPFVISSGRWYVSAKNIADELQLEKGYMIICNGGAVVRLEDGVPLQEWTLTPEQARGAYEIMCKYDVARHAFVRDAIYRVNTRAYLLRQSGLESYLGSSYNIYNDDVARYENEGLNYPYKLEVYTENVDWMNAVRSDLIEAGYSVSSAYWNNLEIMAPGCGKGTAVRWLAEYLGVTTDECMAFGDNTNDLTMLGAVGWPVAVENAVDALKAAARVIAPECAQDGVAQMIEKAMRGEIG